MIKLTITEKGGEPRALSFDQDEVSIGRIQGNDIVLPKGNISKRHSKLTLSDGRIVVSDVKSTNGTYVNGRKIAEPTSVRAGDKIFVGDFLIVIDPGSAVAETSSTGGRRAPPPPPPPPPRPGIIARAVSPADAAEVNDTTGGFGDLGEKPVSTGRGRPPAPPPPPPKRTIVTMALEDDSVDIGVDVAPPSPADVGADAGGDPLAGLASDDDDLGQAAGPGHARPAARADVGSDVFGSEAADDEDAALAGGFVPPSSAGLAAVPPVTDGKRDEMATPPPPVVAGADGSAAAVVTLDALLADPTVTSILIGAGTRVQVERAGKLEPSIQLGDANVVAETVWQIANTALPPPAADNPVVDVRLPDGTRVTALFPPITTGSVVAAIRKATVPELTLGEVAGSSDVEKILAVAVASRRNLLLSGDGPALNALAGAIAGALPSDRRIVSIGAGVKSRPGWMELGPGVDAGALVRAAVAFRADHLLVVDAGGDELPDLLLAAARGQEGVIASVAARSASEALGRLRAFSVGALGVAGFSAFVTSTVDLIVLAGTTAAGDVRVLEIAEPSAEGETLVPLFVAKRPEKNRAAATLEVAGVSNRLADSMAASGDSLPAHLVRR